MNHTILCIICYSTLSTVAIQNKEDGYGGGKAKEDGESVKIGIAGK